MSTIAHTDGPRKRLSTEITTLAQLRQQRGLSLRAVADLTGISNGLISLMERGLLVPSDEQLHALTNALHLPDGSRPRIRISVEWEIPT